MTLGCRLEPSGRLSPLHLGKLFGEGIHDAQPQRPYRPPKLPGGMS